MREFLQGYKGSNRKFMAPVSESKFNADVMEFKDTNNNRVPFQKLIMRDSKISNYTPDDVLKKDMLDKYADINDVFLVVDDRNKVVDMWRSLGLTVFQVADGNF